MRSLSKALGKEMENLRRIILLIAFLCLAGCMVTPLKHDVRILNHSAQQTLVVVPNTYRFDGNTLPAGTYYPTRQNGDVIFYESDELVTVNPVLSPGCIRSDPRGEQISAMLWYCEGGYLRIPLPGEAHFQLVKLDIEVGKLEIMAEHGFLELEEKRENSSGNGNKPNVRLLIKDVEAENYDVAYESFVHDSFSASGLFNEIRSESEKSDNSVFVLFNASYDEAKQNDANMLASALSGRLIPFKHNWNYAVVIIVVFKNGNSKEYSYTVKSSEFVNIVSDMEAMHRKAVETMFVKFFEDIEKDGSYAAMMSIGI